MAAACSAAAISGSPKRGLTWHASGLGRGSAIRYHALPYVARIF
jgi:hypothetical protein